MMIDTLRQVMDSGFDYVNIDLMFSMPGQTEETLQRDLNIACDLGVNGISTYPLMLLNYTNITRKMQREAIIKGNGGITFQDVSQESKQYLQILKTLRPHDYKIRAIWSFSKKPNAYEGPYEHSQFMGIGPRAWGMLDNNLTLNTSNVFDYLSRLEEGFLPIYAYSPVRTHATGRFARCLYHGRISKIEARELSEEDPKISRYIHLMRLLGLAVEEDEYLVLTDKGLAMGSSATKKIAMATLEKINQMIQLSSKLGESASEPLPIQQDFVALS
jgi:oxygen-independent coproporphyrinogen-3 oxidase